MNDKYAEGAPPAIGCRPNRGRHVRGTSARYSPKATNKKSNKKPIPNGTVDLDCVRSVRFGLRCVDGVDGSSCYVIRCNRAGNRSTHRSITGYFEAAKKQTRNGQSLRSSRYLSRHQAINDCCLPADKVQHKSKTEDPPVKSAQVHHTQILIMHVNGNNTNATSACPSSRNRGKCPRNCPSV